MPMTASGCGLKQKSFLSEHMKAPEMARKRAPAHINGHPGTTLELSAWMTIPAAKSPAAKTVKKAQQKILEARASLARRFISNSYGLRGRGASCAGAASIGFTRAVLRSELAGGVHAGGGADGYCADVGVRSLASLLLSPLML